MYCILVTGIPAAGKSVMAEALAERLKLPVIAKDAMKELLFDSVGFSSRGESKAWCCRYGNSVLYGTAAYESTAAFYFRV